MDSMKMVTGSVILIMAVLCIIQQAGCVEVERSLFDSTACAELDALIAICSEVKVQGFNCCRNLAKQPPPCWCRAPWAYVFCGFVPTC
ncbi:hypothetical protein Mapa_008264 [Marchantia paleacea]|nr:hypothetical protein Mapa_008264 [Marchantia paleacea]